MCVWGELNKNSGLAASVAVPVRGVMVAADTGAPAPDGQDTYGVDSREDGGSLGDRNGPDSGGLPYVQALLSARYGGGSPDREMSRGAPSSNDFYEFHNAESDDEDGQPLSFLDTHNPQIFGANVQDYAVVAYGSREAPVIRKSTPTGHWDRYVGTVPLGFEMALPADPWRRPLGAVTEVDAPDEEASVDEGLVGPLSDMVVKVQVIAAATAAEVATAATAATGAAIASTAVAAAASPINHSDRRSSPAPSTSRTTADLSPLPVRPDREPPSKERGRRKGLPRASVATTSARADDLMGAVAAASSSNAEAGPAAGDALANCEYKEEVIPAHGTRSAPVPLRSSPPPSPGGMPGASGERSPLLQQPSTWSHPIAAQMGGARGGSGYGIGNEGRIG